MKFTTRDERKIKEYKNKYGITEKDFVVVFAGRLVDEKGALETIRAIKSCNDEHIKLLWMMRLRQVSTMADSEINVLDKCIEKEALHAMMAVLTEKQRNLIYQNYVLDKTHQEIADGMGIARGSVTRSVNQALERIRRKFDFEAHYELAVGDFT